MLGLDAQTSNSHEERLALTSVAETNNSAASFTDLHSLMLCQAHITCAHTVDAQHLISMRKSRLWDVLLSCMRDSAAPDGSMHGQLGCTGTACCTYC